jgi:hypothetical protein
MALVVLGLFVLVWIISAVVKASQDTGAKRSGPRPRPLDGPRVERTSNSDIDRFMAEIDRLRRKGDGHPAGAGRAAEQPRPAARPIMDRPGRAEPRPRPPEPRRDRDRDRRTRQTIRPVPSPPPLPRTDPVPVLRPVQPAPPPAVTMGGPQAKAAKPAKMAPVAGPAPLSPVAATIQSLLKSPQGPAAALILTEVFGEPRGRQKMRRPM